MPLDVNGIPITFQLDTGATTTLINIDRYKKLGSPICKQANRFLNYGQNFLNQGQIRFRNLILLERNLIETR